MNKAHIRQKLLTLRLNQPPQIKKSCDKKILQRIARFVRFKKADEFFAYLSHRGEVNIDELISKYREEKKIFVPKIHRGRMYLHRVELSTQFKVGSFGIREPDHPSIGTVTREIDVAFIPAVAFDLRGHRIGYGGGYFDRFLKRVRCTTIGLAYEFQIIDKVPIHSYDVAVDFIITEKRIIECQRYRAQIRSSQRS